MALLLPNDSALLPPLWTWRMKKIQKPIISRIGSEYDSNPTHDDPVGSFASTTTLRSTSLFARPSYCAGLVVRKFSLPLVVPVISFPVISTFATWPESTSITNSLKLIGDGLF